jgi:hypothetical protein
VRLEKIFRNGIIEATEKGGLEPRECTFDFNDDGGCRITHAPSGSSFVSEGDFGRWTTTHGVGEGAPRQLGAHIWATVEERAERWAREVTDDVATPDLWAELEREQEILTGARYAAVRNTPFTPNEQTEIAEQLRRVKEFVQTTYSLSEAQRRSFEASLDEVEAAAGRIGRKDWILLFGGAMLGAIFQGLLPPEAVQDILKMALDGVQHLLDGGGGPPRLAPGT